jgi:hypothetical protein
MVDRNRKGWIARRCRATYWGLFADLGRTTPEGKHGRVKCSCCGQGYTVDPHQGGTFLKRHATSKHPRAWEWWCAHVKDKEREEVAAAEVAANAAAAVQGAENQRQRAEADAEEAATSAAASSAAHRVNLQHRYLGGEHHGSMLTQDDALTHGGDMGGGSGSGADDGADDDDGDDGGGGGGGATGGSGGGQKRGRTLGSGSLKEPKLKTPKTPKTPKAPKAKKEAKTPKEKTPRAPNIKKHVSLMHLDPLRVGAGGVALICADCAPCELRPLSFFVAWSGVLTLAWEGFPPAIAAIKTKISRKFPMLPEEKPAGEYRVQSFGFRDLGMEYTVWGFRGLGVCRTYRVGHGT